MKPIKHILVFVLSTFVTIVIAQNSAPSMHLVANFSSDAIVKMQKIKIVRSAQASFFEVNNFNGGYCGLQQVTTAETGSTNTLIASLWDTNTAAGIYSKTEYHDPSTVASRFGGEGDGAKTMNPYAWEKNIWYNIVNRAWKANDRFNIATFIQNQTTGMWFHTSTLSKTFDGYLGNYNNAFMENWIGSNSGQYVRQAFFKDCFFMNTSGVWGKGTSTRFSANNSQADIDRNGIYHTSFNAYYERTEDAFCMQHGGNTVRDAAFNGGRTLALGEQMNQKSKPDLTIGAITELSATNEAGITTVNWKIDDKKSPQLSAKVEILNAANEVIHSFSDTIPNKRSYSIKTLTAPGNYSVRLTIRDIFNQLCPVETNTFTIADSPYLRLSATQFSVQAQANSAKKVEILSNMDWSVTSNQAWLSTNKTVGTGNATITLTATENPEKEVERSAILTVKGTDIDQQLIAVTQKGVETWYSVFNQRGWSSGAPLLTKVMTGMPLGVELTSQDPVQNNFAQQWKIIKNGATDILLINRLTGLAIDGACKASDPAAKFYWRLQSYSGSKAFPGSRIISKTGSIGIHASGSRIFPYNTEAAECFWVFKTPEEIYPQPNSPIEYSYEFKTSWYTIRTPGRSTRNYLTSKGLNNIIMGENLTANNDAQLWKIVDLGDGNVNIINKADGGQIKVPSIHLSGITLTDTDQAWSLSYRGNEQYHINHTEFQLNLSTIFRLNASNSTGAGDASCWIFEKSAITGIAETTQPKITIMVNDKKVYVSGTTLKPKVYNLAGHEVNSSQPLISGVYIVKVASVTKKIIL